MLMRILFVIVTLLPAPSWAALAWVQGKDHGTAGAGSTEAVTWGSNTTTGNFIGCTVSTANGATVTLTGVADSQGNTYVIGAPSRQSTFQVDVYLVHALNVTGGVTPTVTATFSGSSGGRNIACAEFSGVATSSALDQATGQAQDNPGTGANAVSSGNVTTTQADELLLSGTCCDAGTGVTVGTNLTDAITTPTTDNRMEYRIVSSTGTYAGTWTATSGTADFATRLATFKAAVAASPCRGALMMMGVGGC